MHGDTLVHQRYQRLGSCRRSVGDLFSIGIKDVTYLLIHLLATVAKLIKPGGGKAVVAENLLLKQQLIIHSRLASERPI